MHGWLVKENNIEIKWMEGIDILNIYIIYEFNPNITFIALILILLKQYMTE